MEETFKIYIHRLKDGNTEKLFEKLLPDFLQVNEPELSFNVPVTITGEASLADEALVLRLHIKTEATMPCAICNGGVQVKISISDLCYTVEVGSIKSAVFDYQEVVREAILLEVPFITECNRGDCPERATMAKYLTKRSSYYGSTS